MEKKPTLAVQMVAGLGAYCPKVKIMDEKLFAEQQKKAKRRTRPVTGRGNYGKNLMAHFDNKRQEEAKKNAAR